MATSAASKVKGLAQKVLGKQPNAAKRSSSSSIGTSNNPDWQQQLEIILKQRRNVLNFSEYTVSQAHEKRMAEFAKAAPQVFDNAEITPRSKWFNHPNYRRNSQMPPFHVHFRQEMQSVLGYLQQAYILVKEQQNPQRPCQMALRQFRGCMGGLGGHVSIEEYAWFPVYQQLHPNLDLKFLKQDHGHLHRSESKVTQALSDLMQAADGVDMDSLEEQLVATIQLVMEFDQQLMGHLGEEEEVVVPITLAHDGYLPL